MDDQYFSFVRREIAPLLPSEAKHIVDVGCGLGGTAAWVKTLFPGSHTIGLEGNGKLLEKLSRNVDTAIIVDLDQPLPDIGTPDLVLLLDILEHLLHPEKVLADLVDRASKDATFIISLPNIAHLGVAVPLALRGTFVYADAGILDRTHLHFYTVKSAVELAESAGLKVHDGILSGLGGPRSRLLDLLTVGTIRTRLAKQIVLAASRDVSKGTSLFTWRTC